MNDLVHQFTRRQLENFTKLPSHAVMLVGTSGIGKYRLATELSERMLGEQFDSYPYKIVLRSEDGKAIGIEAARQLEHFLSLKVPRPTPVNRVVIIEDAHLLSVEAQNALLKTLEEPPSGSLIIVTTSQEQALLTTVRSRLHSVAVKRPEKGEVEAFFTAQGYELEAIKRAYAISGGLPGLMSAILTDSEHPLMRAVDQARQLLSKSAYERLLSVDELSKQRQLALDVVDMLQQMADVSLLTSEGDAAKKWQRVLKAGYQAAAALRNNAQPKLALSELMLSL